MKAVIEMSKGTKLKIEQDKSTGDFKVDRPLSIPCPHNYGFILGTICPDGDALDIFILGPELPTGTILNDYEVIGYFSCFDNGVQDDKIVAVPSGTRDYDLDNKVLDVSHYLRNYKPGFVVTAWIDDDLAAQQLILDSKI